MLKFNIVVDYYKQPVHAIHQKRNSRSFLQNLLTDKLLYF